jgi:DNA-binding transcriptional LysR family regulator
MLDIRIITFLNLCETKSYTKTAKILNITQPTVTQHIQYLEKKYNASLVNYSGRILKITEKGEKLKRLALAMMANNQKIEQVMLHGDCKNRIINFGSTLTIGEYVMPHIITEYLTQYPDTNFTMLVDNTRVLLKKLEDGIIDFAIIEGYFDKEKYGYKIFKRAEFIGVCAKEYTLANKKTSFDDLLNQRLITREIGSGTRDILETILHEKNLNINNFPNRIELGNFNAIKELVMNQMGITFVYQAVVQKELMMDKLCKLNLEQFNVNREFNIVYLKDDVMLEKYKDVWEFMMQINNS